MREHFVVATAALVVGLESQVPSIYKKQIIPLREIYGFTEDEIEFFDLHITSDVVHGERGYQIVLENANTAELQQRCLQFVRWGAEMRYSYTPLALRHVRRARPRRRRRRPEHRCRSGCRAPSPGTPIRPRPATTSPHIAAPPDPRDHDRRPS